VNNIQVSLCASANRPILQNGFKNWERFLNSLKENKIKYEVIFVGDVEPPKEILNNYSEFKWIYATVKPCQAYMIAFWEAKGELIHWTADDADYIYQGCKNNLDIAYEFYKRCEDKYKDNKTVIAMRPIENGIDVQGKWHYFFGGCSWSPRMAPFGLINRKFFLEEIKGYPNDHICGQAENSVVMSAYSLGGRVEFCRNSYLYVHHRQVHPKDSSGREKNDFRRWYNEDRKALENRWVVEGYGHYEKYSPRELKNIVHISNKPLVPIIPFKKTEDVCYVTQGAKGQWK